MNQPTPAQWQNALSARISDGPCALQIAMTDEDGLLHLEWSFAGRRVRKVCTLRWLVERIAGVDAQ